VKQLTARDFNELFVVRMTLEPAGARLAAPVIRKDPAKLVKNIAATRKAPTLGEITRLDLEFHELILELGGNARLLKLWRSIRGELDLWLGRLHRRHREQKLDTREQTAASHEELVEAFQTQSSATCESLMREHIAAWREWLPTALEQE
jgi:DNA-binding GntR family transcriptional regulator